MPENGSKDSRAKNHRVSKFTDSFTEGAPLDQQPTVADSETRTAATSSRQPRKKGRMAKNLKQLEEMLQSPTNNFGLAALFKNFVLIGEEYQLE